MTSSPLTDPFNRQVTYLRLSVTDRCDLRCTYCMAEKMTFLPRKDLLTLEELDHVANAFIRRGVRKIRITGGEPLVRRGILSLFQSLGHHLGHRLDELTLTTNATQLEHFAKPLYEAGVRRVNISFDSLNPETFARISRRAALDQVLRGIDAAQEAGLRVKINTVALKHDNAAEIPDLIEWAHDREMDLTLIEVMPLGDISEDRFDQYIPLPMVRDELESRWTLTDRTDAAAHSGPARYVTVNRGSGKKQGKLGFITPLTNNFCAGCNRVRLTCTGRIYMCLGQDDHIDLRQVIREHQGDEAELNAALDRALGAKPEKHDFTIRKRNAKPAVDRHMSLTGG